MDSPNHKLIIAGVVGIAGLVWTLAKLHPTENQEINRRPRTPSKVPNVGSVFFTDMLLGVAIGRFCTVRSHTGGDAFGAGLEFQSREWILQNVNFTRYINRRGNKSLYWTWGYVAGMYTDDTEMTMKCLMSEDVQAISADTMLAYWRQEYEMGKNQSWFGIGRAGHGSIKDWYNGSKTIEEIRAAQAGRAAPGNAPPMRALPLAFTGDAMVPLAIINADASHPHPQARAASILVAECAKYLFQGSDHGDIIKHAVDVVEAFDRDTHDYLKEVDALPDYHDGISDTNFEILCGPQPLAWFDVVGVPCDSMRTIGAVLYLLKFYKSPFDILKHSIQMGGDVDSVASICLGVVGGRYGLYDIPQFMFDKVEGLQYLEDLSEKFAEYATNGL